MQKEARWLWDDVVKTAKIACFRRGVGGFCNQVMTKVALSLLFLAVSMVTKGYLGEGLCHPCPKLLIKLGWAIHCPTYWMVATGGSKC